MMLPTKSMVRTTMRQASTAWPSEATFSLGTQVKFAAQDVHSNPGASFIKSLRIFCLCKEQINFNNYHCLK